MVEEQRMNMLAADYHEQMLDTRMVDVASRFEANQDIFSSQDGPNEHMGEHYQEEDEQQDQY